METPLISELRDQAARETRDAANPFEARKARVEWRAAEELERLVSADLSRETPPAVSEPTTDATAFKCVERAPRDAADLQTRVQQLRDRVFTQVSMCAECDLAEQFVTDLDRILRGGVDVPEIAAKATAWDKLRADGYVLTHAALADAMDRLLADARSSRHESPKNAP